jgi:NADH:ubiquinone oxidoreductase subunit 5 (subunit L)/multisubunit Na+/H+ antiporter MnhA subunit
VLVGFLEIGYGISNAFFDWLGSAAPTIEPTDARDLATTSAAWALGGGAAWMTWHAYRNLALLDRLKQPFGAMATVAEHKFYWDEAYDRIAYLPVAALASSLYRFFERWVIWGTVGVVTFVVRMLARETAAAQNGVVRLYATVLVAGAAVLGIYFLSRATL